MTTPFEYIPFTKRTVLQKGFKKKLCEQGFTPEQIEDIITFFMLYDSCHDFTDPNRINSSPPPQKKSRKAENQTIESPRTLTELTISELVNFFTSRHYDPTTFLDTLRTNILVQILENVNDTDSIFSLRPVKNDHLAETVKTQVDGKQHKNLRRPDERLYVDMSNKPISEYCYSPFKKLIDECSFCTGPGFCIPNCARWYADELRKFDNCLFYYYEKVFIDGYEADFSFFISNEQPRIEFEFEGEYIKHIIFNLDVTNQDFSNTDVNGLMRILRQIQPGERLIDPINLNSFILLLQQRFKEPGSELEKYVFKYLDATNFIIRPQEHAEDIKLISNLINTKIIFRFLLALKRSGDFGQMQILEYINEKNKVTPGLFPHVYFNTEDRPAFMVATKILDLHPTRAEPRDDWITRLKEEYMRIINLSPEIREDEIRCLYEQEDITKYVYINIMGGIVNGSKVKGFNPQFIKQEPTSSPPGRSSRSNPSFTADTFFSTLGITDRDPSPIPLIAQKQDDYAPIMVGGMRRNFNNELFLLEMEKITQNIYNYLNNVYDIMYQAKMPGNFIHNILLSLCKDEFELESLLKHMLLSFYGLIKKANTKFVLVYTLNEDERINRKQIISRFKLQYLEELDILPQDAETIEILVSNINSRLPEFNLEHYMEKIQTLSQFVFYIDPDIYDVNIEQTEQLEDPRQKANTEVTDSTDLTESKEKKLESISMKVDEDAVKMTSSASAERQTPSTEPSTLPIIVSTKMPSRISSLSSTVQVEGSAGPIQIVPDPNAEPTLSSTASYKIPAEPVQLSSDPNAKPLPREIKRSEQMSPDPNTVDPNTVDPNTVDPNTVDPRTTGTYGINNKLSYAYKYKKYKEKYLKLKEKLNIK